MLVVMRHGAADADIQRVVDTIEEMGYQARPMPGKQRTTVGLVGNDGRVDGSRLAALPGVHEIIHVTKPYKQVSREWQAESTIIRLPGGLTVGGDDVVVMAGPCSVESERQILDAARLVREAGATVLRAGAFKPRTSPYSFQGLGQRGLEILAECRAETGLPVVTEVIESRDVEHVAEVADCLQIGTRNMQNFALLKEVGQSQKPVLLKRGLSATVEEWLMAAEYVAQRGNSEIILCERGIRTFETATRNTLDLAGMVVAQNESHLPVIVDPSHATGQHELVAPMARAALAAGADGVMLDVHHAPTEALCDGAQALTPDELATLGEDLSMLAAALGRS
jgi:3-deoxy-7-phosphoheptulonate synthase